MSRHVVEELEGPEVPRSHCSVVPARHHNVRAPAQEFEAADRVRVANQRLDHLVGLQVNEAELVVLGASHHKATAGHDGVDLRLHDLAFLLAVAREPLLLRYHVDRLQRLTRRTVNNNHVGL